MRLHQKSFFFSIRFVFPSEKLGPHCDISGQVINICLVQIGVRITPTNNTRDIWRHSLILLLFVKNSKKTEYYKARLNFDSRNSSSVFNMHLETKNGKIQIKNLSRNSSSVFNMHLVLKSHSLYKKVAFTESKG